MTIPYTARLKAFNSSLRGTDIEAELDRLYADANDLLTQIENVLGLNSNVTSEVLAARKGQPNLLAEIDRLEAIKAEVEAARNSANQGGAFASLDARLEAIDTRITNALSAVQGAAEVVEARTDAANKVHAAIRQAINNGSKDLEGLSLSAINRIPIPSASIVDAIIYDPSRDSDGAAWRERCQHLSWFNEMLQTGRYLGVYAGVTEAAAAGGVVGDWFYRPSVSSFVRLDSISPAATSVIYRGNKAKFPAIALLVATSSAVFIFDAADPMLPMWMVFTVDGGNGNQNMAGRASTSNAITSIAMLNGLLCVGLTRISDHAGGLRLINFLSDSAEWLDDINTGYGGRYKGNIAQRNALLGFGGSYRLIVNRNVNRVAAAVLPSAPIDPATGLPIPIVVANTAGGVSLIRDDGAIVNSALVSTGEKVAIIGSDLWISNSSSGPFLAVARNVRSLSNGFVFSVMRSGLGMPDTGPGTGTSHHAGKPGMITRGASAGIITLFDNPAISANGMVANTTKDYFSGILPGDIRRAWLANSPTADRSVKNKPLTMVGALTAASVTTGAELLCYSGFSASNYLEEPYSADLDFGTGDFLILGWLDSAAPGTEYVLERGAGILELFTFSGAIRLYVGGVNITSPASIQGTGWRSAAFVRRSGTLWLYLDGVPVASVASVANISGSTPKITVGTRNTPGTSATNIKMALLRLAAFAPSPEQIRMIYEYEKHLFTEGAKCLIGGTSSVVQALDYDPETGILLVGTANGVSLFQGLRRTDYLAASPLTNTSMKAVAGINGAILMASGAEAVYQAPQRNIREEVERVKRRWQARQLRTSNQVATTAQVDFDLPTRANRINAVYQDGKRAVEGSGASAARYAILDYGYKQTIRFGAAPGDTKDVAIEYYEEV